MNIPCFENPYQREFTAEIINVLEIDNKYHIELDKTYFYPGFEEHTSDKGVINSTSVESVYEKDGKIYHVVGIKPLKIHRVKCSIDWSRRYNYMQHHLGQHIISACIKELFNSNTLKIHITEDVSFIDVDKVLGIDEIERLEKAANDTVFSNIPVEILYPSSTELKKLGLKNISQRQKDVVRIVKIGDIDLAPCYGLHPSSTIEVQLIKVTKWLKTKSGTKLEFSCGSKAVSNSLLKYNIVEKMARHLSCNEEDLLGKVESLKDELNRAFSEKRALKAEILEYEVKEILVTCEEIKGVKIIKSVYEKVDFKSIDQLALKLTSFPSVIVLFAVKSEDRVQLIFMCSRNLKIQNMNLLMKDAITLIDGKGGGNDFSAQGGGKNNNNLDSLMEYAYSKIKANI